MTRLGYRFIGLLLLATWLCSDRWCVAEELRALEEQAIKAAVARVAPSIVRIETVGGLERVGQILIGTGPTTGLIVSDDGYIVSSAFNFVQKPDSILVTLADGTRAAAKLVATDHSRMTVLLKIQTDAKLPVPDAVPQGAVRVGQWAIAIGRTFEGSPNASVGIVSAVDRIWGKAIQTDAKVSPTNYGGPLIDISGRVLGVLVPMSPDVTGEVAGVEWYDSGIGFAIPLEHIEHVLPTMKAGTDLRPGLLGISLEGADLFSQPPVLAACRAKSPAYKSGFRAGDKIVEVGGRPITRQAQLKQELGGRYAGDRVQLVAMRGNKRLEREVELTDKLELYEYPFLGILPMRAIDEKPMELTVRYVYPESPAAKTGIEPGDHIRAIDGDAIKDSAAALERFRRFAPGETIKITLGRGDKTLEVEARLGRLPESLPGELPPAHSEPPRVTEHPQVGTLSIKIPELENQCVAYVPANYQPQVPHGVVIWLHAAGGFKKEELVELWKDHCAKHNLILLAPKSADPKRWQPTEILFVRRALDDLAKHYNVDPARIVVHGHEAGGAMAYLVGFSSLDVVRGIATIDAPLPLSVRLPDTDPVHRLAIYTTLASKASIAPQVEAGVERLRALKYPVTVTDVGEQGRYLTPSELAELARWIDALDRI